MSGGEDVHPPRDREARRAGLDVPVLIALIGALITTVGNYAVTRYQVAEIDARSKANGEIIVEQRVQLARLIAQNEEMLRRLGRIEGKLDK